MNGHIGPLSMLTVELRMVYHILSMLNLYIVVVSIQMIEQSYKFFVM